MRTVVAQAGKEKHSGVPQIAHWRVFCSRLVLGPQAGRKTLLGFTPGLLSGCVCCTHSWQ